MLMGVATLGDLHLATLDGDDNKNATIKNENTTK